MLAFRNTPCADGHLPAQLLFGRRLCTSLPALPSAYKASATMAAHSDKTSHETVSHHWWRGICTPGCFNSGEAILVQDPSSKEWSGRGTIVRPHNDRSFDISMNSTLMRHNKWFLSHVHSLPSDLSRPYKGLPCPSIPHTLPQGAPPSTCFIPRLFSPQNGKPVI
jgi:hypothetical protein